MLKKFNFLDTFLSWRKRYISEKHFILFLSILIGIVAGLVAILLKKIVHFLQHHSFANPNFHDYFYLFPFVGILLSIWLSQLLYRERIGHAISDILFAIFKKSAKMSKNKMYSRFLTSMVTVGLGGSAGLEAPIVLTGSAIGSNIASAFSLDYKNRVLLIGCGSAAVISAIFNAPIAGLIFSVEVILFDINIRNFIPLLASSLTATLTSILLYEDATLFVFKQIRLFQIENVPYYILLGVFCALVAIGFNKSSLLTENFFRKIKNRYGRFLLGTSLLSLSIMLFPSLYGEGYFAISDLLNNQSAKILNQSSMFHSFFNDHWEIVAVFLIIILMKYLAFGFTIGAGGAGGTFAPSLFLGCFSGFTFARMINLITGSEIRIAEGNFALVGMCGVLSATQYAPLTAIFLIAELTGGYTLFVPLMIVSAISYTTVSFFNPDSPYIRHLIDRGEYIKGSQDKKILSKLNSEHLIEKDFKTIDQDCFLKDLIQVIKKSNRHIYPVLNEKKELVGMITLEDVREKMFEVELQNTIKVRSLMSEVAVTLEMGEKMTSIVKKFEQTEAWNLPVLNDKKYIGFISKSRIFNFYREELLEQG